MAYVGNVAAFLAHTLTLGPGIHIYNYVDSPDMNTRDLVAHIRRSLGKSPNAPHLPMSIAMGVVICWTWPRAFLDGLSRSARCVSESSARALSFALSGWPRQDLFRYIRYGML